MKQKEERLAAFIMRRGKELFGDSFIIKANENHMPQMVIRGILGEHVDVSVVEMEIMQYDDGTEVFWSGNGGFLKEETIKKLRESEGCQIGIRNNRIGTRERYVTPVGEWIRVNHFSTEDSESADVFLEELCEFRKSTREDIRYPNIKIDDFCGKVWKMLNDIFNENVKDDLKVEYFPSFNSKDSNCYSTFTVWLREDFFVQVRIYPDCQEFVCKEPGRYWRKADRSKMSCEMRKEYDKTMAQDEQELASRLTKIENRSTLLAGGNIEFPYLHIGAVHTSNIKVVECLCNYWKRRETTYWLEKNLERDAEFLRQKDLYHNFY